LIPNQDCVYLPIFLSICMIILNEQSSLFETQKLIINMYFEKYTHIYNKLLTYLTRQ